MRDLERLVQLVQLELKRKTFDEGYTRKDVVYMTNGTILHNVHTRDKCARDFCCIHNPSQHKMVAWPYFWDNTVKLMMRMCPHHILHPDPDGVAFERTRSDLEELEDLLDHTCDNCCKTGELEGVQ